MCFCSIPIDNKSIATYLSRFPPIDDDASLRRFLRSIPIPKENEYWYTLLVSDSDYIFLLTKAGPRLAGMGGSEM